jgi:shikimate kinase
MSARPLALVGPRGAGKSTVGRALAERLERPFVDLDDELVRVHDDPAIGSAGELLAALGEAEFRRREAARLEALLAERRDAPFVLATGGGVVETDAARRRLAESTDCVWLIAGAELLRRRLADDPTPRPALIGADAVSEVDQLLARREPFYRAAARFALDVGDASPEHLAEQIVERLG